MRILGEGCSLTTMEHCCIRVQLGVDSITPIVNANNDEIYRTHEHQMVVERKMSAIIRPK